MVTSNSINHTNCCDIYGMKNQKTSDMRSFMANRVCKLHNIFLTCAETEAISMFVGF